VLLAQETRSRLDAAQLPAAATLIKLMSEAQSEHVMKDTALAVLKIAGIGPNEGVTVNTEISVGYVINLSKRSDEPQTIEHEPGQS